MSDYKFKVGDKVKLISDGYECEGITAGTEGVIKSIDAPVVPWPYYIEFKGHEGLYEGAYNIYTNEFVKGLFPCNAEELEAV